MSTSKPQPQHDQDGLQTKASAAANRPTRTLIVIAIALTCVIVMLVLSKGEIGEKSGHTESENGPQITTPREAVSIANSLLAGVPQHGNVLGNPTAPVTLEFFANFECLPCREFAWWEMRYLIENWIPSGKLRIEYRSEPSASSNFTVFREQQAGALAAGAQNKMWNFIETAYFEEPEEGKGELPSNYVQSIAAQVPGLNLMQWDEDRNSTSSTGQVIRDVRFDTEHHLLGTPAFLLGKTGGSLSETVFSVPRFNSMMRELLGT